MNPTRKATAHPHNGPRCSHCFGKFSERMMAEGANAGQCVVCAYSPNVWDTPRLTLLKVYAPDDGQPWTADDTSAEMQLTRGLEAFGKAKRVHRIIEEARLLAPKRA